MQPLALLADLQNCRMGLKNQRERASRDAKYATCACDAAKAAICKDRWFWVYKKQTALGRGNEMITDGPDGRDDGGLDSNAVRKSFFF